MTSFVLYFNEMIHLVLRENTIQSKACLILLKMYLKCFSMYISIYHIIYSLNMLKRFLLFSFHQKNNIVKNKNRDYLKFN